MRGSHSTLPFNAGLPEPVAWIRRGTAEYRSGNLAAAARTTGAARQSRRGQCQCPQYLAQTLLDLGLHAARARNAPGGGLQRPQSPLREAVLDTRERVDLASEAGLEHEPATCRALDN